MFKVSKHMIEITTQIARKKQMKPEELLLSVLLETYKQTFKKEYLL
jgi:hypothetical protein